MLPASSIFTKIEHSKNQFIRETFENAGRKLSSVHVSNSILIPHSGSQVTCQAAYCLRNHSQLSIPLQSLPTTDVKMMAEK